MAALEADSDPLKAVFTKEEGQTMYLKKIYDILVENMGMAFRGCCPMSYRSGFRSKDAIECLMSEGIADSSEESISMMRTLIKHEFIRLCEPKLTADDFAYSESQLVKFTHKIHRDPSSLKLLEYGSDGNLLLIAPNLYRVYNVLSMLIEIRDRTIGSETYFRCFLGCDAVDCMVDLGIVRDWKEGLSLGYAMVENNLIKNAVKRSDSGSNLFSNRLMFFQFTPKSEVDLMFETKRFDDEEGRFSAATRSDYREMPLEGKQQRLKLCIRLLKEKLLLKDVSVCGKTRSQVFQNKDLIQALVSGRLAESPEEASMIGQGLMNVGLVVHCADPSKPFLIDSKEYYRFVTPVSKEQIRRDCDSIMMTDKERTDQLLTVLSTLKEKVTVKDRSSMLRKYKSCFVGSEAVAALIDSKLVMNEIQAVLQCQNLIEMGKIVHVSDASKAFANEKVYFRFVE